MQRNTDVRMPEQAGSDPDERSTRQLLNEWQVEAALPSTFNAAVWRRIERARPVSLAGLVSAWFERLFARPAVAVSYSALALMTGLGLGQWHASRDLRSAKADLQFRYIHAIDPYAKPITP